MHVDQPIAIGHRQALQECGVDDGEDGGVGADAEGERQDGGGGEAWPLPQHARGVAEILADVGQGGSSGYTRRDGRRCVRLTEGAHVHCERRLGQFLQRQAGCLRIADTLGAQPVVALVEMLRQLLHDLGLASGIEAQGGEVPAHVVAPVRHDRLR